jgi:hypothetical protein
MVELATQAVEQKLTKADVIDEVRAKKTQPASADTQTSAKQASSRGKQPKSKDNTGMKTKVTQVEIVLDRSCKICVIGTLDSDGPEAILEILRRGMDKLKAEIAATI